MSVPSWWPFLLLALAVYRLWRLLALDTILDRPRGWLFARAGDKTAELVECPFCFGWWLSLAVWAAWEWQPHWTLVVAVPFALSAVVALIGSRLDPAE